MGLSLRNQKQVAEYLQQYGLRIEKALVLQLEYYVTELQNHAKTHPGYEDQTGNLKASIGGAVLKNGKPITYRGFEGSSVGTGTGIEYLNSLLSQYTSGYVLILVAGMEYATYVENFYGLNVLKKSELKMRRELPKLLQDLKRRIK